MKAGLRIDVDTYRGTKRGVPRLLEILASHRVVATFFFSVGPDNMGRHILRVLRPQFAWKMLRTGAPSLYGWDILFKGTLWPGPPIGRRLENVIRSTADAGHEVGLHAWDHHRWQTQLGRMSETEIREELKRGVDELTRIVGRAPSCSAAPGWICTEKTLGIKEEFPFEYNSDCRGRGPFLPVLDGRTLLQPQIPTSLPTYDEMLGTNGVNNENYNDRLLAMFEENSTNVLTIHAEAEGISAADNFDRFLAAAEKRGIAFGPLREVLKGRDPLEPGSLAQSLIAGREGPVAVRHC